MLLLGRGSVVSTWQAVRATVAGGKPVPGGGWAKAMTGPRGTVAPSADAAEESEEDLRRTLYLARMNMAQHAWETGGVGRMLELLEQYRPAPRGAGTDPRL